MTKPNSSFRESLEELERITQQLEADEIGLDEAIEFFERGSKLAAQLQSELEKAQVKIEKIKVRFDSKQEQPTLTEPSNTELDIDTNQ